MTKWRCIDYVRVVAAAAVLFFIVALTTSCTRQPVANFYAPANVFSEGDRVGVITKFSYKGYGDNKTWEGELNLGGLRTSHDTDGDRITIPNVFEFSVDPEVAGGIVGDVQNALATGDRVKVHYIQVDWLDYTRGKTSYFVQSVTSSHTEAEAR